jgi:hypothetical protein
VRCTTDYQLRFRTFHTNSVCLDNGHHTEKLDLVSTRKFVLFDLEKVISTPQNPAYNANYKQKRMGMICVVAHKQASYLWLRSKPQKGRLGGYSCVLGEQKMHDRLRRDFCVSHPIESDMRNGQLFRKEYSMTRAPIRK